MWGSRVNRFQQQPGNISSLRSASRPVHQPGPALPSVRPIHGRGADARASAFFAPCNFRTTHGIIGRCVWAVCCGNGPKHDCAFPSLGRKGTGHVEARARGHEFSAVQPIHSLRNLSFRHKPCRKKEPTSSQETNESVHSRLLINKLLRN